MALNIRNKEVERLAAEVAELAEETKIEALRKSLLERKRRLMLRQKAEGALESVEGFLEEKVWPHLKPESLGKATIKKGREDILGYARRAASQWTKL